MIYQPKLFNELLQKGLLHNWLVETIGQFARIHYQLLHLGRAKLLPLQYILRDQCRNIKKESKEWLLKHRHRDVRIVMITFSRSKGVRSFPREWSCFALFARCSSISEGPRRLRSSSAFCAALDSSSRVTSPPPLFSCMDRAYSRWMINASAAFFACLPAWNFRDLPNIAMGSEPPPPSAMNYREFDEYIFREQVLLRMMRTCQRLRITRIENPLLAL